MVVQLLSHRRGEVVGLKDQVAGTLEGAKESTGLLTQNIQISKSKMYSGARLPKYFFKPKGYLASDRSILVRVGMGFVGLPQGCRMADFLSELVTVTPHRVLFGTVSGPPTSE